MKRYFKLCFAGILIWSLFFATACLAGEDNNPMYKDWSQYKPGSFVVYKTNTETTGVTSEVEMTYTLKEVTPEKVVLEVKTVTVAAGMKVETPGELIEFPAKGEGDEKGFAMAEGMSIGVSDAIANGTRVDERMEKVKIKDKEIEVQRITVNTEDDAGSEVVVTAWCTEEIPGGMAKSITEVKGFVPVKVEQVVTDFKTIK